MEQGEAVAPDVDHRGSRRLSGRETAVWYGIAGVSYVGVGMFEKGLLTWIIGPVWLITVVVAGPALWDRLRRRR